MILNWFKRIVGSLWINWSAQFLNHFIIIVINMQDNPAKWDYLNISDIFLSYKNISEEKVALFEATNILFQWLFIYEVFLRLIYIYFREWLERIFRNKYKLIVKEKKLWWPRDLVNKGPLKKNISSIIFIIWNSEVFFSEVFLYNKK